MAEQQEFISKEQVKVLFIENFLGNFWELFRGCVWWLEIYGCAG